MRERRSCGNLQVNLCQSVISKLASRHRTTGRVRDRPRSGVPPVTDHNHDQNLRTSELRHGLANATQLQTIHNRLYRFMKQMILLISRYHCEHLQWRQDCVTWKIVGSFCTEMMVVSVTGEGKVRSTWFPRLALVEEV
uniref:Uncharacterized protein n=1 Tax=Oryzias sinensis TaxID=183150 RepID=A0A8C7WQ69_9TELE